MTFFQEKIESDPEYQSSIEASSSSDDNDYLNQSFIEKASSSSDDNDYLNQEYMEVSSSSSDDNDYLIQEYMRLNNFKKLNYVDHPKITGISNNSLFCFSNTFIQLLVIFLENDNILEPNNFINKNFYNLSKSVLEEYKNKNIDKLSQKRNELLKSLGYKIKNNRMTSEESADVLFSYYFSSVFNKKFKNKFYLDIKKTINNYSIVDNKLISSKNNKSKSLWIPIVEKEQNILNNKIRDLISLDTPLVKIFIKFIGTKYQDLIIKSIKKGYKEFLKGLNQDLIDFFGDLKDDVENTINQIKKGKISSKLNFLDGYIKKEIIKIIYQDKKYYNLTKYVNIKIDFVPKENDIIFVNYIDSTIDEIKEYYKINNSKYRIKFLINNQPNHITSIRREDDKYYHINDSYITQHKSFKDILVKPSLVIYQKIK